MIPKFNTEQIVYAIVTIVLLAVLVLLACSPDYFTAGKVVYQGF
ncbi:MAG TPA: hypothetical protein VK815_08615 [Candidatus Acidoferrales bacterium]|jgi:hypothetical protein|nr:hypothetical protein [Candidatus Acidoferrales bacterium]